MSELDFIIPLLVGFFLDAVLGDPRAIPHPVILFGKWINVADRHLNKGNHKKLKGVLSAFTLIILAFACFYGIIYISTFNIYIYYVVATICVFLGLANRGLISECLKVQNALEKDGLEAGRKQLSYIVGRDTTKLNEQQIRTAILETMAENLSDGVIAPMFYYALGGLPLLFAYKMINTLDSMIGYKSEKYRDFGWFAAKTDDMFNYIPARLTALVMAIIGLKPRAFTFIVRYGHRHSSPNAGYPEAALAGILNCRFGGPNVYHGKLVDKPFIGANERPLTNKDLKTAVLVNAGTSVFFLILVILFLTSFNGLAHFPLAK
jgi:adenosylcobinamide-phosphate synthase